MPRLLQLAALLWLLLLFAAGPGWALLGAIAALLLGCVALALRAVVSP